MFRKIILSILSRPAGAEAHLYSLLTARLKPCPFTTLLRFSQPEQLFSASLIFQPGPAQRILPVGECPHCDRHSIANGIDIGKIHFLPLTTVLGTHSRVNKYYDPVTGRDELYWFADNFCPGGS